MRKSDIDKILNQESWTGHDVGRLLVAVFIESFKTRSPKRPPAITYEDIAPLIQSLDDEEDRGVFEAYNLLQIVLAEYYNKASAFRQHVAHHYDTTLQNIVRVSDGYRSQRAVAENAPLLITRDDYRELNDKRQVRRDTLKLSYSTVLFNLLAYYLENEDQAPEAVAQAINATKEETATNRRILENYNRDSQRGYIPLPDGSRARPEDLPQLQEEWEGEPYASSWRVLDGFHTLYAGVWSLTEAAQKASIDLPGMAQEKDLVAALELLYTLRDDPHLINLIRFDISPIEEGGITKYMALEACHKRYSGGHARRVKDGKLIPEIPEEEQLAEFIADYGALYSALVAHMAEYLPGNMTSAEVAQAIEGNNGKQLSYDDMKDIRLYAFAATVQNVEGWHMLTTPPDDSSEDYGLEYVNHMREKNAGYALVETSSERGKYNQSLYEAVNLPLLNNLAKDIQTGDQISWPDKWNNNLRPLVLQIAAYNKLIEIITKEFGITEGKYLQFKIFNDSYIERYNYELEKLYNFVYGSDKEKSRLRSLIPFLAYPMDFSNMEPLPRDVRWARKYIRDMGYITRKDMALLLERLADKDRYDTPPPLERPVNKEG